MGKKVKAVVLHSVVEAVSEELADWFWGHRNAELIPEEAVKQRVVELRAAYPTKVRNRIGEHAVWYRIISDCRTAVEQKHPGHTVIRLRGIGWKLSNDSEYADFTVAWAKRTFNAAARTMSLAPHMKRECIGPSVLKAFGNNESDIRRLAQARHEFALTILDWKREMKSHGKKQIKK